MRLSSRDIPAVILAGGEGVRLGRGPKALVNVAGKALMAHVRDRLAAQSARMALSVRRTESWAEATGLPLIFDDPKNAGPLAGVAAAAAWARPAPVVLTCPTDSPLIPADLCLRLAAQMDEATDVVVAASNGRRHHLTALWRASLAFALDKPMPVHEFQGRLRVKTVDWPIRPFDPFLNINTVDDLTSAQQIWSSCAGQGAKS